MAVFNPAVVYEGGRYWMLYRAQDRRGISRLGLATSSDGVHFTRESQPVLSPTDPGEAGGIEDPRLVRIGGLYYLTYTGYDGRRIAQTRLAVSENLRNWQKLGAIIDTPWNKAGAILEQPLNGLYFMYFGDQEIQLATSSDLRRWQVETGAVLKPRPGMWDEGGVEPGPPPLLTPRGILLIYNGRNRHNIYAVGAALFSAGDPSQLLARSETPILKVEAPYEQEGTVPNVVFAEGLVVREGLWRLYYGGGDRVVALATWRQP
ncbi:MAG: glycosidase [Meiothermus sp.]